MAEDDGPLPSLPEGALAFLLGQTGTLGDDPSVAAVTQQTLDDRLSLYVPSSVLPNLATLSEVANLSRSVSKTLDTVYRLTPKSSTRDQVQHLTNQIP